MSQQLINAIKDIALKSIDSQNLSDIIIGQVESISPLSIKVDNYNISLPEEVIDVVDTLRKFEQTYTGTCQGTAQIPSLSGSCSGEGGGAVTTNPSSGSCSGTCQVTVTIDNSLKVGDKVHIIRQKGGRRFLVVGRLQ